MYSWLVFALLSTSATAFYPYPAREEDAFKNKRLASSPIQDLAEREDSGVLNLDIKRISRRTKRDNVYPVVPGSKPDMPNAMAIDEDGQDYTYFSAMRFGSTGQKMYMLIDTGSANTWVMGSNCTSNACQLHNTFGPPDSATLNLTSTAWSLSYGTGTVQGIVASDTVAFANYSIELGFGLATVASDDFSYYPMDGILGLGRPASDAMGTPSIMQTLAQNQLLRENIIGINLQRSSSGETDGQITFGAIDVSKFADRISYTNTLSNGNWEIPVDAASVNGISCNFSGKTTIIDTGTSFILMPSADAQAVHSLIAGSTQEGESYMIPCGAKEVIQFTFSGVTYDVTARDYLGKAKGSMCASNIIGHQAFGPNQWILGDVFLKNVYSVFDFDKNRIGFGVEKAASPTSSTGHPSATSNSTTTTAAATSTTTKTKPSTTSKHSSVAAATSTAAAAATSFGSGSPMDITNSMAPRQQRDSIGLMVVAAFVVGLLL